MERIVYIILGILLSTFSGNAQHCGWDNSSMIIVEVRDEVTGEKINNLSIVLVDSAGVAYTSEWNEFNYKNLNLYQDTKVLKFGQNVKRKGWKYSDPFPFARRDYMLLVYPNNYRSFNRDGTDLIKIEDVDGTRNRGKFKTTFLPFKQDNIISLCESMPIWRDEEAVDKVKLVVYLKPE